MLGRFNAPSGVPDSYCFDVVNEAVIDSNEPTPIFKNTTWYPALPTYVSDAFTYARAANASTRLFYNDYGAEGSGVKSDKVYNLVAGFLKSGVPIDGVGLQMVREQRARRAAKHHAPRDPTPLPPHSHASRRRSTSPSTTTPAPPTSART